MNDTLVLISLYNVGRNVYTSKTISVYASVCYMCLQNTQNWPLLNSMAPVLKLQYSQIMASLGQR